MAEAADGDEPSAQDQDGEQPVREAEVEDGHLHAVVAGEITLHNSPAVRGRLLDVVREERPRTADLDLGGVPYMDSSAVAVLVEVLKAVRQAGGDGDHRGEHPVRPDEPEPPGPRAVANRPPRRHF